MWTLFIPEISIAEKILRSGVVYLFLLLAFRFTGKRQVGQLTPFDLVVLLIISNVVQNAVIGNDTSLGGGLIGAVTILALNYGLTEVTYRSKRARRLIEAQPTLLIHNGRILQENLRRERITLDELLAALRRNGLVEPAQAHVAVLEENGGISVIPRPAEGEPSRLNQGPILPHQPSLALNPLDSGDGVGLDERSRNPIRLDGGWNGEGPQYHP